MKFVMKFKNQCILSMRERELDDVLDHGTGHWIFQGITKGNEKSYSGSPEWSLKVIQMAPVWLDVRNAETPLSLQKVTPAPSRYSWEPKIPILGAIYFLAFIVN